MTMSQSTCEFASASDWWNLSPAPSGFALEEFLLETDTATTAASDVNGIERLTNSNAGDWV
jgi:hypothetical protein